MKKPESEVFTKEMFEESLEMLSKPQPIFYNAVCFNCRKSFLSYKKMNHFLDCAEHLNNEDYKMIMPLTTKRIKWTGQR